MTKDRTRHARRREPERVDVSLFDMAAQDIGREFAESMLGFAEKYRRFTDGRD